MRYVIQVSVEEKPQRYTGLDGLFGGSDFIGRFFQQLEMYFHYFRAINQRAVRNHR
ncbi:hypothetical protein LCGC14_1655240 [marine sediment metagenome]|uniref:Uncharacterized protein n=1 Tax=marine sediment metagenome TaxID=412755 RepID=A0A0F9HWA7_9ZZZZ